MTFFSASSPLISSHAAFMLETELQLMQWRDWPCNSTALINTFSQPQPHNNWQCQRIWNQLFSVHFSVEDVVFLTDQFSSNLPSLLSLHQ